MGGLQNFMQRPHAYFSDSFCAMLLVPQGATTKRCSIYGARRGLKPLQKIASKYSMRYCKSTAARFKLGRVALQRVSEKNVTNVILNNFNKLEPISIILLH